MPLSRDRKLPNPALIAEMRPWNLQVKEASGSALPLLTTQRVDQAGYQARSKRPEEFSGPRRFGDLPRRWVVERTFSWLSQNRRMSKDYERLPESSEALVYVAMSRLMVRRLATS